MSEAELVIRSRGGDERAFRHLVELLDPFLRGLQRQFFAGAIDEEDIYQEGLIGLHRAVRDYRPGGGPFKAFARMCMKRRVITAVRMAERGKHQVVSRAARLEAPLIAGQDDVVCDTTKGVEWVPEEVRTRHILPFPVVRLKRGEVVTPPREYSSIRCPETLAA